MDYFPGDEDYEDASAMVSKINLYYSDLNRVERKFIDQMEKGFEKEWSISTKQYNWIVALFNKYVLYNAMPKWKLNIKEASYGD